ncbi:MAG: hypothetical protein LBT00_07020 [Spirochaetaceae bacterium]|nr:hypothetical protein [Spirochaetaceae bacterium]
MLRTVGSPRRRQGRPAPGPTKVPSIIVGEAPSLRAERSNPAGAFPVWIAHVRQRRVAASSF